MKGYGYYPKRLGGTRDAIKSFERLLPRMGNIVKVIGTYSVRKHYRVTFINDQGQRFQFYGFAWWYGGEGPRGLQKCLNMIGIDEPRLLSYTYHGSNDINLSNSFILHKCNYVNSEVVPA